MLVKLKNIKKITFNASTLSTSIELVKGGIGTTLVPEMAVNKLITSNPELTKIKLDEKGLQRNSFNLQTKLCWIRDLEKLIQLFSFELNKNKKIKTN